MDNYCDEHGPMKPLFSSFYCPQCPAEEGAIVSEGDVDKVSQPWDGHYGCPEGYTVCMMHGVVPETSDVGCFTCFEEYHNETE